MKTLTDPDAPVQPPALIDARGPQELGAMSRAIEQARARASARGDLPPIFERLDRLEAALDLRGEAIDARRRLSR